MLRVINNERKFPRQFIVVFDDEERRPVMVDGPFRSRTTAQRAARRIARHRRYLRRIP